MEYTILGRTGLNASVAGLGCGGPSRLGLRNNADSEASAISLVRQAIDLGVNFLDTAQSYGTEPIVGKAIAGLPREQLVISTKKTLPRANHSHPAEEVIKGLEQSLKSIGTDYIDIYHLHGVEPEDYAFAKEQLMPAMRRLRDQGKIRFVGVSEGFATDSSHRMLQESLREDMWDVVMVGFNLLNPSARKTVFPLTAANRVGVLNMFSVRRALSQPERLITLCAELVQEGMISRSAIDLGDPLGFLLEEGIAATIPEAAYRFCRHEPAVDVVLTGTGNPEHLKANIDAILKPALPPAALRRLKKLFGGLDSLTAN